MAVNVENIQPVTPSLPRQVKVNHADGQISLFFLQNNPWKLCESNTFQKIFRFCLVCGKDRFGEDRWNRVIGRIFDLPPLTCDTESCRGGLNELSQAVWMRHCVLQKGCDADDALKHEQYETIEDA